MVFLAHKITLSTILATASIGYYKNDVTQAEFLFIILIALAVFVFITTAERFLDRT